MSETLVLWCSAQLCLNCVTAITSCMVLSKFLDLSLSWFPHFKNGVAILPTSWGCYGDQEEAKLTLTLRCLCGMLGAVYSLFSENLISSTRISTASTCSSSSPPLAWDVKDLGSLAGSYKNTPLIMERNDLYRSERPVAERAPYKYLS